MTTTVNTKEAWKKWHAERVSFKARETQGFSKDAEALRTHITNLQEVGPKDKAGWLTPTALEIISQLQKDYLKAEKLLQSIGKD